MAIWIYVLIVIGALIVLSSIRIINQYEKGLVFTLGKFTKAAGHDQRQCSG